ncbi:helix-turn-helix domain-containing protein [Nocardia sputi]|uniref:helix-turn-helix domain-containing protein n=1 Tax=Nocardia sputi TaxID=2943705 RepID=UPI0035592D1D
MLYVVDDIYCWCRERTVHHRDRARGAGLAGSAASQTLPRNSHNRPAKPNTSPPIKNSSAPSRRENWTDEPRTLEDLRERKLAEGYTEPDGVTEARREIRLSMALAKAVYDRRTELGLTQADLAERAGLTQAKISRIEGSDTVPTLPLLAKLADALDATLNIALDADDTRVNFTSHHTDAA